MKLFIFISFNFNSLTIPLFELHLTFYREGEGIGKRDHGRKNPLQLIMKNNKFGIDYE